MLKDTKNPQETFTFAETIPSKQGYVAFDRSFISWPLFYDQNAWQLFCYLMMAVNFKTKAHNDLLIHRGSILTSYEALGLNLNKSRKQIKNTISKLKRSKEIDTRRIGNGTLITLVNYSKYQALSEVKENTKSPLADNQEPNLEPTLDLVCDKPHATTKEGNKEKIRNKDKKKEVLNFFANPQTTTEFDDFWQAYIPVRVNDEFVAKGSKSEAQKKYNKFINNGEKHETIFKGMQQYLNYCRKNSIKSCGVNVFLNQKRWCDDYGSITIEAKNTKQKYSSDGGRIEVLSRIFS